MMRHSLAAALTLVAGLAAAPASACAVHQPLDLRTALSADLVVVGRIASTTPVRAAMNISTWRSAKCCGAAREAG
jgi:hypothetical protein